jgi:hypothetical protein
MHHRHKLLDLTYAFHVYIDEETKAKRLPLHTNEECSEFDLHLHDVLLKEAKEKRENTQVCTYPGLESEVELQTSVLGPYARSPASSAAIACHSLYLYNTKLRPSSQCPQRLSLYTPNSLTDVKYPMFFEGNICFQFQLTERNAYKIRYPQILLLNFFFNPRLLKRPKPQNGEQKKILTQLLYSRTVKTEIC